MVASSSSAPAPDAYAISDATRLLMPNDSQLRSHLYRHVANEFFCAPKETKSDMRRARGEA